MLPALLAALRVAGTVGGRALAAAGRTARAGASTVGRASRRAGVAGKDALRKVAAEGVDYGAAENRIHAFYSAARAHYATPVPSQKQLGEFAASGGVSSGVNAGNQDGPGESLNSLGPSAMSAAKALGQIGGAGILLGFTLKDWTAGLKESLDALKRYSPAVAGAAAMLEAKEHELGYKKGTATGGSLAALTRAKMDKMDAAAPMSNAFAKLTNNFSTAMTKMQEAGYRFLDAIGLDEGLNKLSDVIEWLARIAGNTSKDPVQNKLAVDFLRTMSNLSRSPSPDEQRRADWLKPDEIL